MGTVRVTSYIDKKSADGFWLESWNVPTGVKGELERHSSLSGRRWRNMRKRASARHQIEHPSYQGVSVGFRDFQDFTEWSRGEVGYDRTEIEGSSTLAWAIDKDLFGSKEYNQDSCLFIPKAVNSFLLTRKNDRGEFPLGVSRDRGAFRGRVSPGSSAIQISRNFETPEEAHRFWQESKIGLGEKLRDEFWPYHPKLVHGLTMYIDRIREDYNSYRITEF